jgi:4-hydroxy-tetrahydrodipicolinate reductase
VNTSEPLAVAVWGTGQVGQACIRLVRSDPRLRLSGVIVHAEEKQGRDAGELAGIERLGVAATRSLDEGLAGADAVLHTTPHDPRRNCDELCAALAAGVNAVSIAGFVFPYELLPDLARQLDQTAITHGVSVHGTGVNPGFCMDVLPLTLSSVTSSVERVWCDRVTEMARFPRSMIEFLGVNRKPEDGLRRRVIEGNHLAIGQALGMLAAGLRLRLDDVVYDHQPVVAERRCQANGFTVEPGRVRGVHHREVGLVEGREVIVLDLRLVLDIRPELDPFCEQLYCEVTGQPSVNATVGGAFGHEGYLTASARGVNAVPAVVAARPGLKTSLDLALVHACVARAGP